MLNLSRFARRKTQPLASSLLHAVSSCFHQVPPIEIPAQHHVRTPTFYGVDTDELPSPERERLFRIIRKSQKDQGDLLAEVCALGTLNFDLLNHNGQLELSLAEHSSLVSMVNARRFMEHICKTHAQGKNTNTAAWRYLLKKHRSLTETLRQRIPSWAEDCEGSEAVADVLARKLGSSHQSLNNKMHTFVPGSTLTIIYGIPDEPTTTALECIARHFKIKVQVKEMPKQMTPTTGRTP